MAQAIAMHGEKMPAHRKEKLLAKVQNWWGQQEGNADKPIGAAELSVVAAMEWRTIAADFVCSDQRLVEAVMGHGSFKGDCCTKCLTKKAADGKHPWPAGAENSLEREVMYAVTRRPQALAIRWRQLLLDSRQPKHMPVGCRLGLGCGM